MNNGIQLFAHEEFGQLRTIIRNGNLIFAGIDIATPLGYKDTDQAIREHVEDEDKFVVTQKDLDEIIANSTPVDFTGVCDDAPFKIKNPRGMIFINESGMYSLILSSNLPSARRFKHWVTSVVIPSFINGKKSEAVTTSSASDIPPLTKPIDTEVWLDIKRAEILVKAARLTAWQARDRFLAEASLLLTGKDLIADDNSKLVIKR